uniref:Lactamase_B domain-containing protein n=1 Tax=Rhabditophanes sp. KR3021 TaxID=114890 RepID=A0AC35U2A8_9BILA
MRKGIISRSSQKWTLVCTSILIRDRTKTILIDPGLATSSAIKKAYFSKLSSLSMSSEDITDVIITNGHPDHVTDTNAFPNGVLYQNGMLFWKSTFVLLENGTIPVSENVKIISMSGQASQHLGVIILNCPEYPGIVSVTGDIFMSEKDLTHPYLWQTFSSDIQKQELVRNKIICNSDWIIPGHGNIFPVTRALRLKHCF